jgi:tripartite-type tricarboxylate transporter receptor subunit TctC
MEHVMGKLIGILSSIALAAAAAPAAHATDADKAWPDRTVRIMTGHAGSSPDAVARTLADALAKRWNHPVIVENRAGADHILAVQGFLEAQDGHTLLFTTHSVLTVNPLLHAKLPYDPERDFAPISLAVEDFLCVAAAPSLGVDSLNGLVKVAAAKPGDLNAYTVPGSPHLSWLAFQKRAGISTTFVPYKAATGALADLSEGRIHVAVVPFAVVRGQAEAGRIKVLAVTNAARTPAAPEIPTVAEAGYPDFTFGGLLGLFGRKDMALALQERIARDVREILNEPEVRKRLTNLGLLIRGTTPAEFRTVIGEQRAKWAALARAHGIRPRGQ